MDRRDLAIHMRMRIGDWNKALNVFKEVKILKYFLKKYNFI
jgi:hypothetical protein